MSEDVLRHQNQKLRRENDALLSTLAAVRKPDPILVKLARAIRYVEEVGTPGTPGSTIGEGGKGAKPTSRPPSSSGDRQVRHWGRYLANDVDRALSVFWGRADGEVKAKRVKSDVEKGAPAVDGVIGRIPSVRCRSGSCTRQGKRTPAYSIDTGDASLTVNRECGVCGVAYPSHPSGGDDTA